MQIVKYGFIQICVYFIDLASFILIYNYLEYSFIIANSSSKIIACIVAFFIHKFFTFKSKGKLILLWICRGQANPLENPRGNRFSIGFVALGKQIRGKS